MHSIYIKPTDITPEIRFLPEENIFLIRGTSSPEDVRALYYPVIEWIRNLVDDIINIGIYKYSADNPFRFQVDLFYFNSSSAKFLYDIFLEIKRLSQSGIPVVIEWYHEREDLDLRDAGSDIALLAEMEFRYIIKENS